MRKSSILLGKTLFDVTKHHVRSYLHRTCHVREVKNMQLNSITRPVILYANPEVAYLACLQWTLVWPLHLGLEFYLWSSFITTAQSATETSVSTWFCWWGDRSHMHDHCQLELSTTQLQSSHWTHMTRTFPRCHRDSRRFYFLWKF